MTFSEYNYILDYFLITFNNTSNIHVPTLTGIDQNFAILLINFLLGLKILQKKEETEVDICRKLLHQFWAIHYVNIIN